MMEPFVIQTCQYAPDVRGFGGPVPLEIHVSSTGVIDSITALPNNEDTQFWNNAKSLLHAWDGVPVSDVEAKSVDVVTGATYSSRAIIEGVRQSAAEWNKEQNTSFWEHPAFFGSMSALIAAIVAVMIVKMKRNKK